MKAGNCKHFNGAMNKQCDAGISYDDFSGGIPCLKFIRERCGATCERYQEPTPEEIKKSDAAIKEAMERMTQTLPWIAAMKAKHKGTHGYKTDVCPICGKEIRFSISSYNGHMRACCETPDCVNFIE